MLKRIERILLDLSVMAVIALGAMITANVFARAVFNVGIPDSIVIVRELMIAAIVLPLAAVTANRGHIAVEFLTDLAPRPLRAVLIALGSLVGLLALIPLIFAGSREFFSTLESGSFFFGDLNLPKWPGQLLFVIGLSFFWIRLFVLFVQDICALLRGDFSTGDAGHAEE
ncbi:MAG: TRAP transporter small permease [Pseudomonadota bacterium]